MTEDLVFTKRDIKTYTTLTLDDFLKQQKKGRSGREEFRDVVEKVQKKHPDVMMLLRDVVYDLLLEKEVISAVDVYNRLDEMGANWFDRRYIGVVLGDMKRHGEIISIGMTRNPRRHGVKIELFKRADFVSADVIAHIEGVKV